MTKVIGLTGRSGAGKGAACQIFLKHGVPAIDTDAVYHRILAQPGPCTDELALRFGREILDENGLVDRKKLSACVFGKENTPDLLHSLNEITHKYIMAKTWQLVQVHRENGARAVLIDAPQLFEAALEKEVDLTLGVIAPDESCVARIMARDGISRESAEKRLAAQHNNAYFREKCTAVIENNGSLAELESAICRFLQDFGV